MRSAAQTWNLVVSHLKFSQHIDEEACPLDSLEALQVDHYLGCLPDLEKPELLSEHLLVPEHRCSGADAPPMNRFDAMPLHQSPLHRHKHSLNDSPLACQYHPTELR